MEKHLLVIGIIFLFVGLCFQPAIGVENRFTTNKLEKDEDLALTFHIFNKNGERQKESVIAGDVAIQINDVFEELRHLIRNEPMSEETQALTIEFVELLDMYDLIPKGLSKNFLLSFLNPFWLNSNQRTHSGRSIFPIIKNFITRLIGVFSSIQQFLKLRFKNKFPIDINENIKHSNSLMMNETAGLSFISGAGSGGKFPYFLFPRPRFIFQLSFTNGGVGVDPDTGRGFDAWAPLNALFFGFIGLGITIPLPFPVDDLVFVFFGYTLNVSVSAKSISYYKHAPKISDIKPPHNAIDVPISLSELSFRLTDADGDPLNYTVTTSPDIGTGSGSNVGNGVYSVPVSGLERNTNYRWFLKVNDGIGFLENQFTFKTES